jgi:hypothetical protein
MIVPEKYNQATHRARRQLMKPGIKKAARRKTMRVATVFTGAAACMTGLGPAATAGTGHYVRPMLHTGGNITRHNCNRSTSYPTWLHMQGSGIISCFGFTGTYNWDQILGNSITYWMCGGNNVGWYSGIDRATGKVTTTHFHEGTNFVPLLGGSGWYINKVHISGWSGNDKCSY